MARPRLARRNSDSGCGRRPRVRQAGVRRRRHAVLDERERRNAPPVFADETGDILDRPRRCDNLQMAVLLARPRGQPVAQAHDRRPWATRSGRKLSGTRSRPRRCNREAPRAPRARRARSRRPSSTPSDRRSAQTRGRPKDSAASDPNNGEFDMMIVEPEVRRNMRQASSRFGLPRPALASVKHSIVTIRIPYRFARGRPASAPTGAPGGWPAGVRRRRPTAAAKHDSGD